MRKDEVQVRLRMTGADMWAADATGHGGRTVRLVAPDRREALRRIRAAFPQATLLMIEESPQLVGVAEAAELLGWDKRRVATYVRRGSFPDPVAALRSGRVWRREDIEAFVERFRARQAARARHRTHED